MLISSFYHFTFSQPVYHPLQNKKRLDEHILIKSFFVLLIEIRLNMLLFSRKKGTSNKPTTVLFLFNSLN
ncbi:hypothetical protein FO510_15820 [Bacillus pumilus]|nr:conserved hypothetical protein [Bacillus pumilus ATCC 7061]MDR4271101.1 hypothetical protein [Bacillus pumilus]